MYAAKRLVVEFDLATKLPSPQYEGHWKRIDALPHRAMMTPDRWFQFEDLTWPPGADPYLYRWTLTVLGRGRRCYLHRYRGADWARDLHDHPKVWDLYTSLPRLWRQRGEAVMIWGWRCGSSSNSAL